MNCTDVFEAFFKTLAEVEQAGATAADINRAVTAVFAVANNRVAECRKGDYGMFAALRVLRERGVDIGFLAEVLDHRHRHWLKIKRDIDAGPVVSDPEPAERRH